MTVTFFRTVSVYLILLTILRLTGKRQVGELQPGELVTALLLSDLASIPIADPDLPLLFGIVPLFIIASFEVIFSFLTVKFRPLEKIFSDKPSVIISRGRLDIAEMKRVRMTFEELMSELRLKDIGSIGDVYYAILEPGGKLSVIKRDQISPERGISRTVIEGGRVNEDNLKALNKDGKWLEDRIRREKCRTEDIIFMSVDDAGRIYTVKK